MIPHLDFVGLNGSDPAKPSDSNSLFFGGFDVFSNSKDKDEHSLRKETLRHCALQFKERIVLFVFPIFDLAVFGT